MGYLYSLPVKGLVKPKETRTNSAGVAPASRQAANITEATVAALAKPQLEPTHCTADKRTLENEA
jgi:hypothetical protein